MEQDGVYNCIQAVYRPLYVYALSLSGNRSMRRTWCSPFLKALLSYEGGGSLRYWLTKVLKMSISTCGRRNRLVDGRALIYNLSGRRITFWMI